MADRPLPPIMIGITGKRDLLRKDAAVADALQACFDLLDRELPVSAKTLLTGLAAGADMVAAKLALDRGWKIVAVLPFSLDVYLLDFDSAQAEALLKLVDPEKGILRDPARGRVIVLDPLRDPKTGLPFSAADLSRRDEQFKPVRNDHYEQIGLFIADACALLIGVMPASEKPERVGGTARIIEYRLCGMFDRTSEEIVERSRDVAPPIPVDAPQFRPVWLVDLESVVTGPAALSAVQVWRRGSWRAATPGDESRIEIERIPWRRPEDLMQPLRLAARIEAFNARALAFSDAHRQETLALRARDDEQMQRDISDRALPDSGDAAAMLKQVRSELSVIQRWAKTGLARVVKLLAVLFVFEVLALEVIHLEIRTVGWQVGGFYLDWSVPYVALSIFILIVLFYARLKKLSQYTEDYRAVAEALRVQLVWWSAGLSAREYRVDRMYLCGTAGTLGLVRAAIRYLVSAALVERPAPAASPEGVMEWITEQIKFFGSRAEQRRRWLAFIEELVWFLFVGSIGIGIGLVLLRQKVALEWIDAALREVGGVIAWAVPWGVLALAIALYAVSRAVSHRRKRGSYGWRRFRNEAPSFFLALLAGIGVAGFCYGLLSAPYDGAEFLNRYVFEVAACKAAATGAGSDLQFTCAQAACYRLLAVLTALVAAVAGALRFYSERMAQETELHSYQESLATFSRVHNELARLGPSIADRDRPRFEQIVLELGKTALKENESWIRAHRVRPLEPHV